MIEHSEVEVDEPVDEPTPSSPHVHGTPSALDVIKAAIVQRLPCATCGQVDPCRCLPTPEAQRVDTRAAMIQQALIHYGHLPDPEQVVSEFDPQETAQWLADRSGFPRYTQVEGGWKRLLEAEADVELASIKALRRVPTDEVEMVKAAKAALLSWLSSV